MFRTSALALLLLSVSASFADPLPKSIESGVCKTPPSIDGVIGMDEWRDAKVYDFDVEMIGINPPAKANRACRLWIMNSANALYVAFRVPDTTFNASLNPLDFDFAILAFCKGKKLATGDDRKVIAPGLYVDKHFVEPNQDADDQQSNGRGAVAHEKGLYSFEWAIELDSGDKEDLQAQPGDSVRFNLGYFDGFRAELKDTQAGSVYGGDLNSADTWGTLELARKVEKDDGSAFRGPAWVDAIFKGLKTAPAKRLNVGETSVVAGLPPVAKALVSFDYRDEHGKPKEGHAGIYLPMSLGKDPKARLPLFFAAGYEINDAAAAAQARLGQVVVTPRQLEANPLIRTPSPDVALLHMARALPCVDDKQVVIAGGSAGGYMTLMLAAETFPLLAAEPDVPPVNWGYNAAYFFKQSEIIGPEKKDAPGKVPVLHAVGSMLAAATEVYGEDFGDATWYAHSPVAQVPTVTCPVSVHWTTADILVPMNQVGNKWVKPFDANKFPPGFTNDPEKLLTSREGRTRLMDVLKEGDYEVHEFEVPKGTALLGAPNSGKPKAFDMPIGTRQWTIAILDEGPPEPLLGHAKYAVNFNREKWREKVKKDGILPNQLTAAKLERLMDRYAGKEWLPSKLQHLDEPESEKADVLRGLRTYTNLGAEHAKTFAGLYAKLPKGRQVLDEATFTELSGK